MSERSTRISTGHSAKASVSAKPETLSAFPRPWQHLLESSDSPMATRSTTRGFLVSGVVRRRLVVAGAVLAARAALLALHRQYADDAAHCIAPSGDPVWGPSSDNSAGVPGYIIVQLIGAVLACLFLQAVIGVSATYGSNYVASGYSAVAGFWMEAVLTLGLVSVILGTASGAQNIGIVGAFGVGAYIALAGLWGSPISGASMNPYTSADTPTNSGP